MKGRKSYKIIYENCLELSPTLKDVQVTIIQMQTQWWLPNSQRGDNDSDGEGCNHKPYVSYLKRDQLIKLISSLSVS